MASPKAAKHAAALDELAYRLYAEHRRALLVVLQGMDTSGKDGTIRHVMSGVSPQTCKVVSFKQPNSEELEHDFLWRVHRAVPPNGQIGIFNRSHYEDVLVVRVHELVEKSEWKSRYAKINEFEKFLTARRNDDPEILPAHQPRRAARSSSSPDRRPAQAVEDQRGRRGRATLLGRLSTGLRRRADTVQHRLSRRGTSCPPITNGIAI